MHLEIQRGKSAMQCVGEYFKRYLKWFGFALEENARFGLRIWADSIAAATYSAVSIVLIVVQKADLVVLGLNILCLFRATINSTICASEVTNMIRKADIESKCTVNNHYRTRGAVLLLSLLYTSLLWIILSFSKSAGQLYYESEAGTALIWLIKAFASLAILFVLYNDLENNLVHAYGAYIKPID